MLRKATLDLQDVLTMTSVSAVYDIATRNTVGKRDVMWTGAIISTVLPLLVECLELVEFELTVSCKASSAR